MAAFVLQWQGRIVVTETAWFENLKVLWPFAENVSDPAKEANIEV